MKNVSAAARSTICSYAILLLTVALCASASLPASAQSATDMAALKGLAPVTALTNTPEGRAALAANYTMTGGIQTGAVRQPTLLPFAVQQQQALQDAFITGGDLAELADGLGTTLGSAYQARAHYLDRKHFTNISPAVADLIAYSQLTAGKNSHAGKFFFANETTDGKTPVSADAKAILQNKNHDKNIDDQPDVFGRAYHLIAGTPGANPYGDSRPFQTEPSVLPIVGTDYFNVPATNHTYNRGPIMDLIDSPSYPSGHTTYGYTGTLLLAMLVPERYQQLVARGAEYGNDRIIMGAHYAMDVMGGRTLAMYDMAHLLANDPAYMGITFNHVPPIHNFRAAVEAARTGVTAVLQAACGDTVEVCARQDHGRLSDLAADEAFYSSTQTYNLPIVYPQNARKVEDVAKLAPDAGYLLTVAFPTLTLQQADQILTQTEGPGGRFLDNGSSFGIYSRLDLYAAAGEASAMASNVPHGNQ